MTVMGNSQGSSEEQRSEEIQGARQMMYAFLP